MAYIRVFDNSHIVELVESTKFLGVYIHQHFTCQTHTNVISKKIAKSIGLIYGASFYLHENSLLSLYYVLIYPYLTYCNLIWPSTYITNLQGVYLLQKRVVRLFTKSDYRAPCKALFLKMKILDVFSIYSLQAGSFMYVYHVIINCHFPSATLFKLVDKFIVTQQQTRNPINLIFKELILKSFLYFIKDLEYGIPYLCISKQLQVFSPLNNL